MANGIKSCIIRGIALALLLAIACASALADGPAQADAEGLIERLVLAPEFKFRYEKPEGYGLWPVFSAPSWYAFRSGVRHNARYDTESDHGIGAAGYTRSGWLMIGYQTAGGHRVGYVPPEYVRDFKTPMILPVFDSIPAVAEDTILVTESHFGDNGYSCRLYEGDSFSVLGKYTYYGDWWYIEFIREGQQCRGFIDRNTSRFSVGGIEVRKDELPDPAASPKGAPRMGTVTIDTNGLDKVNTRSKPDPNSGLITAVYHGETYPCYAEQMGTTGKPWYYIFIERISTFCWVSSGFGTLAE